MSTAEREKARLLLAEDDPITRKVLGMLLQKSNFDLDIAEHGLQAVEMWEKGNYDLILMDVQMPHMDGFAATGSIREKEREGDGHTLIVAMTAHAFPEDELRCRAAGMDAFIFQTHRYETVHCIDRGSHREAGRGRHIVVGGVKSLTSSFACSAQNRFEWGTKFNLWIRDFFLPLSNDLC